MLSGIAEGSRSPEQRRPACEALQQMCHARDEVVSHRYAGHNREIQFMACQEEGCKKKVANRRYAQ